MENPKNAHRVFCPSPLSSSLYPFIAGAFSFFVCILLYCPRFYYWELETGQYFESNRAFYVNQQLENPWIKIPDPSNVILEGRLLLPVLFYYLSLPKFLYFILPFLCCFLVSGYIAMIVARETKNQYYGLASGLLMTSASWFFFSTGVLAYYDSFIALGLLLLVFAPSTRFLILLSFICSWVDERYILALPICLTTRAVYYNFMNKEHFMRGAYDAMACLIGIMPYLLFRGFFMASGEDSFVEAWLTTNTHEVHKLILGAWHGQRVSWLFGVLFAVLVFKKEHWKWGVFAVVVFILSVVESQVISGDYSRTTYILLPTLVLGILLTYRYWPKAFPYILFFALLANLIMPAHHYLRFGSFRIHKLPEAIQIVNTLE